MSYARITTYWGDGTRTTCEFGTNEPSHPDLLDSIERRAVDMWRETCAGSDDDKPADIETDDK